MFSYSAIKRKHFGRRTTAILGCKVAFTIGQTLGDYPVLDVIGSSGMGTVYRVQHVISNRVEALRVILPNLI